MAAFFVARNHMEQTKIVKVDADRQFVFGWANVSIQKDGTQVTDSHNHQIDPEDLENAAYLFALAFGETGVMHEGSAVGRLIESFFVTSEKLEKMGLPADALPQGWWVGFYVEDQEVFEKVKKGDFRMFSIQGRALVEGVS